MAKQLARYDNYHSLATISADGTQVLVLFKDGTKHYPTVINITTGKEIARLDEHFVHKADRSQYAPTTMSLSPNGLTAVLGRETLTGEPRDMGYEYDVIIWDVRSNQYKQMESDFGFSNLLWLDNSQFVVAKGSHITIYNTTGEAIGVRNVNGRGGYAITRQADWIAVAVNENSELHLLNSAWELQKTLPIGDVLKIHRTGTFVAPFFLSHDAVNVALITRKQSDTVWVWDVPSNELVTKVLGDTEITTIAWLQNTLLLYAEWTKSEGKSRLMLWDMSTGGSTELGRIEGEVNRIIAIEDKIIVSTNGFDEGIAHITVWDAKSDLNNEMPR